MVLGRRNFYFNHCTKKRIYMRKFVSVLACILACTVSAKCQSTITFDDLAGGGLFSNIPIANGYQGFNWSNFGVANTTGFPLSGLLNGTVSPSDVAYNFGSSPAYFSATDPFILVSGYFTSAARNGMTLEVTGLNGTATVFDQTFTLDVYGPSLLTFPSIPVTEVNFATSGGVFPGPDYVGGGSFVALDNLTVAPVPEPSTIGLVGLGLGGLFTSFLNRSVKGRRL